MTQVAVARHREAARQRLKAMQEEHASTAGASGGRLRAAVFGVNDGLVSNAALVIGVAAAEPGRQMVLLAGIAGLIAGAFSMAAGEYISMRVQREVFEARIALERHEIARMPAAEREEVSVIFQAKGVPPADAERVADHVMADPDVALDLMAREELGLNPDDLGSPSGAGIFSFLAFSAGAIVPILPYLLADGATALLIAVGITALGLFAVGYTTAQLTDRPHLWGGIRMMLIGGVATGVTYLVGRVLGVSLS
jgi:VIT1/CCC1 family predicted Fe2+/Mn2+ transporter